MRTSTNVVEVGHFTTLVSLPADGGYDEMTSAQLNEIEEVRLALIATINEYQAYEKLPAVIVRSLENIQIYRDEDSGES